ASGIPQLVAEVSVAFAALEVEIDIAAQSRVRSHCESQGVSAIGGEALGVILAGTLFDAGSLPGVHKPGCALRPQFFGANAVGQGARVDGIALGLAHRLPLEVADEAAHIDIPKWHLAGKVHAHHYHPGNPEEDDVESGDQHA